MMLYYLACTSILCIAFFLLGKAVGFIIGFKQAASDIVVKQLEEMEAVLGGLDAVTTEDAPLILVRLDKDETKEPVN
tara:strand:+ start:1232 stop:1462 length:231 start_codon:yes stop_codon:yes gene_type:complete